VQGEEARKRGMWFPASLDKRDAMADKWFAEYSESQPWVTAVRDYRRANTLAKRINSLYEGMVDGWIPFELLYFGAGTTGRWSGGGVVLRRRGASGTEEGKGRFNWQNMNRDSQFGVDLRYCAQAPEGKLFYIVDYSQIECRILLWRAGDSEMLEMIRNGVHPYKAYAVRHLGAPADLDKKDALYLTGKACVLGCGYQAGATAFQRAAKALAGLDISLERATELVRGYRASNPLIVDYWRKHHQCLQFSANAGDPTHEVELASGRVLTYFNPCNAGQNDWGMPQVEVQYTMGEDPDKIYGGLLTENEIQATARDVLRDGWVSLTEAGFDVPLTVHDEYVILGPDCDEKGRKAFCQSIREVLKTSSPWAAGCPLDVGIGISDHYEK
jgi:DNA polymerase